MSSLRIGVIAVVGLVGLCGCSGHDASSLITGTVGAPPAVTAAADQKRDFDCVRTRQILSALASSLSGLEPAARQQEKALPTTAVATIRRLSDPRGPGLAAVAQFETEKARYTALASAASQNACPTTDYDETVRIATERMLAFRAGH